MGSLTFLRIGSTRCAAVGLIRLSSGQRCPKPQVPTQGRRRVLRSVDTPFLQLGYQPINDLVEATGDDVRRNVEAVARAATDPGRQSAATCPGVAAEPDRPGASAAPPPNARLLSCCRPPPVLLVAPGV